MKYPITEERRILQDSVGAFLAANHDTKRSRRFRSDELGFDQQFWAKIAEMGWLALRLPERLDGLDMSIEDAAVLLSCFGEHAVTDPYIVNCLMPAVVLSECEGASSSRMGRQLVFGEGAISMMAGDTPVAIESGRASKKIQAYVATAESPLLLLAQEEGAPAVLVIEPTRRGVVAETHFEQDGTMTASVELRDVEIKRSDLLLSGARAGDVWSKAIREGNIALAAQLTGLSRGLLALTLNFAKERVQFGQSISGFQVIQHKLVNLHIAVQLAESSFRKALRTYMDDARTADIAIHAAKARASDVALDTARAAIQIHGAMGYAEECDVACYLRSAMTLSQTLGNAARHRQRVWSLARTAESVLA
jgi:3-oxochol-4-en-24-oyl-CoA dehydrogenase